MSVWIWGRPASATRAVYRVTRVHDNSKKGSMRGSNIMVSPGAKGQTSASISVRAVEGLAGVGGSGGGIVTPKIAVIGCGGGGCNAVDAMVKTGYAGRWRDRQRDLFGSGFDDASSTVSPWGANRPSQGMGPTWDSAAGDEGDVPDVRFVGLNMDAQALAASEIPIKVQLGPQLVHGLGAGANPNAAVHAVHESADDVSRVLQNVHLAIVVVGLGGGTGTGVAPLICDICRRNGIVSVAVATLPFWFEGKKRAEIAQWGLQRLDHLADAVMTLPNDGLSALQDTPVTLKDAFSATDRCIQNSVDVIASTVMDTGMINLDFNDVRSALAGGGRCFLGWGEATVPPVRVCDHVGSEASEDGSAVGTDNDDADSVHGAYACVDVYGDDALNVVRQVAPEARSKLALERALEHDLLKYGGGTLHGASHVLLSVVGGRSMSLGDVDSVARALQTYVSDDTLISVGAQIDESMGEAMTVRVLGSGFAATPAAEWSGKKPKPIQGRVGSHTVVESTGSVEDNRCIVPEWDEKTLELVAVGDGFISKEDHVLEQRAKPTPEGGVMSVLKRWW